MTFRRVITGHTADGRSTCLKDEALSERPGWLYDIWQTTQTPADNSPLSLESKIPVKLMPPKGGITFRLMKVPPQDFIEKMSPQDMQEILQELGAEDSLISDPGHMMKHRTDTLDFLVVLQGQVTLHLDDGDVELKPFDSIVQRSTAHAWTNYGDTDAYLAVILVDALPLAI